jgi:hypothetical protein
MDDLIHPTGDRSSMAAVGEEDNTSWGKKSKSSERSYETPILTCK